MLATLIDQMKHQRKHFMVYINIYFLIINQFFIKIEEKYEKLSLLSIKEKEQPIFHTCEVFMVTAATWESAKVCGIRALNVALDSIKQEIIHAKFTV